MDYSKKTIPQLKAICKERKIKGITRKNKNELVELLKKNDIVPVSASKIDAKTDVKIEPQVKVYIGYY
jgi:predicted GIY-YIG superfamily endonuclease